MSQFTDALVVPPLADGKTWVICEAFGYEVGRQGSGDFVSVEKGFQTDFATIPRLFWILLPRWGRYGNASVIHDWLYWRQTRPRRESDDIFREGMGVLDVKPLNKWLIYWAVRLFGGLAWYRNRADRAAGFDRVRPDIHGKASRRSGRVGTMRRVTSHALGKRPK